MSQCLKQNSSDKDKVPADNSLLAGNEKSKHSLNHLEPTEQSSSQPLHYHFIGVAGIGMSGLARWAHAEGLQVSGCDYKTSAMLHDLAAEGLPVCVGHDASHLDAFADGLKPVDVLVCSMAIPQNHPELVAAREKGIPVRYRIDVLGDYLRTRQSIAITGTHGKSTTTGMVAHIFLECQQDPSVLVGAHLPNLPAANGDPQGTNVRHGQGEVFIAEVDESDPGFANLSATLAVVTNLEDDHIAGDFSERRNYHASLADLESAALCFMQQSEAVLYCADWQGLAKLIEIDDEDNKAGDCHNTLKSVFTYGLKEGADYQAKEVKLLPWGSSFVLEYPDLQTNSKKQVSVILSVPGEFNVQNAVAALASAHYMRVDIEQAAKALYSFTGVGRRWQHMGQVQGALIIDDYAHHPTEIAVTLEAAKNTKKRVRAVLQPHRWVRTARHWRALADAASLADEVLVLDIYSAGEKPIAGVSPEHIVERIAAQGTSASYHSLASAVDYLSASVAEDDLVITLGAGDVWQVGAQLVANHKPTSKGDDISV